MQGSMSGINRFLSRRDRRSGSHNQKDAKSTEPRPVSRQFDGAFCADDLKKKPDKDEEKKVKALTQRLHQLGIENLAERQIEYALRSRNIGGDSEKALQLLLLFEDSWEGIIKPYSADKKMLGAENREAVTCFLDALLFAMFARLESFEAMLYNTFNDKHRKNLAALLRLWVNLLRTGRLVTTDITKQIQEALANCGWEEARKLHQQDASEAFTFITGKLELPLLTLKMDIYHTGKEDAADDHKFVNERLLEVAIPPPPEDGSPITLEDCLEHYFNNRIEVKRHLQRRNTLERVREDKDLEAKSESKGDMTQIETIELSEPSTPLSPAASTRPISARTRADSIFSQSEKKKPDEETLPDFKRRKSSLRKEVLMPAWQFFSLIPWYTDNAPTSDAQVAAHFSKQRPVLGICLKRYTCTPRGTATKLSTQIDIPLEIALPHFVSDDRMEEEGPLFGNFKLSLQSVVCHRGLAVDSGHYIALVKGETIRRRPTASTDRNESSEEDEEDTQWLQFDDLARERVKLIDIDKALREESPYLLFYQVQPIDEDLARGNPPSYSEATDTKDEEESLLANTSSESLVEVKKPIPINNHNNNDPKALDHILSAPEPKASRISIELPDFNSSDNKRGRSSTEDPLRRGSIVFVEKVVGDNEDAKSSLTTATLPTTAPTTPADESRTSWLGTSRRGSKASNGNSSVSRSSKSRPSSQSGEGNRLSLTMSRLTGRISRDKLLGSGAANNTNPAISISPGPIAATAPAPSSTTIAQPHDRTAATDFAGRTPEKEDAAPVVEIAEVDPASRSRSSTTATTPAMLTPAASSAALVPPTINSAASSSPGRLEVNAAATTLGEKETPAARKSVEVERSVGGTPRKSGEIVRLKEGGKEVGKETGKEKEGGKKGSVMRSRSRHLEKKKAKATGERPDRECAVM
ncbi:cysteine proteinase [Viridothelium virens]|uniref:ubiquitinyl hydrolase 1 n=1 Tax=Viridothelium virens TaxID=1048519 RepID=A0A6A6HKM6_VIRVR|nr:cysteine proteinase [Viridothelium virens]